MLVAVALALSENRRAINLRVVLSAFALQAGIAVLVIYVPAGKDVLAVLASYVQKIIVYADEGTAFLFGEMATNTDTFGFIVALKILPVIVFVSSLVAVLYHLRVMQFLINVIGGALRWVVGISRVEAMCAAANIFIGMVEAPMAVRPYLGQLTRSQFFTVMGVGLSTITGALVLAYASLGLDLSLLIAAAFMSAPGGILMSKLLIPEEPGVATDDALVEGTFDDQKRAVNVIEAAADGAASGLNIALNVGAMLVAFVALLALANGLLSGLGNLVGIEGLTFEYLLGLVLSPLMFLLGIPWSETVAAGNLVGQKTILNEFVAYVSFLEVRDTLSAHTQSVLTFALCGFANLSALAIMLGGIGSLVPERRADVAALGLKAVLVGTLSNLMSAALASLILSF